MSWQDFCMSPPDLKAAYGGQFHLRMTREFEPVKLGANVEVAPQGSHVLYHLSAFSTKKAYSVIV